jgi:hypothetical protein
MVPQLLNIKVRRGYIPSSVEFFLEIMSIIDRKLRPKVLI